jgi:exopolysaccharide biosynthesis polyprenyl glycosylphosphotransferase
MYKKFKSRWFKHADFLITDVLALSLAYISAALLRFGTVLKLPSDFYPQIALLLLVLNIFIAFFDETYSGILRRGYLREARSCLKHVMVVLAILLAIIYLTKNSGNVSRIFFLYLLGFSIIFTWIFRCVWKKHVRRMNVAYNNVIVLANSKNIADTIAGLSDSSAKINGLCICDRDETGSNIKEIPVIASVDNILDYIKDNVVDGLIVNLDSGDILPKNLLSTCINMGVPTHECLAYTDADDPGKMIETIGKYTVLTRSIYIASAPKLFIKRLFDIFASLIGLIITAVLTLIVGPAIYIASPGPIFFTQKRVGRNGRKFNIYKFRSMYMDAEERKKELMKQNKITDGMMFKMDDDPRIIKGIGHFIRKFSIDEFPQFWNVLRGDMSLVGTRPPTVQEYEKYDYHHKARLAIKPGITGLWQVNGRSDITDFEQVVKFDTDYITNWSLSLDLKIIFKTVLVVLKGNGAA